MSGKIRISGGQAASRICLTPSADVVAVAKRQKVVEGLLSFRGGVNDCGLVRAQNAEPVGDVARMIVVQFVRQIQMRANQAASDLSHKLLETISFVAEPLAEGPGKARAAA